MSDQTNVEETQAPAWKAPVREVLTELLAARKKANQVLKAQLGPVFEELGEEAPVLAKPYVYTENLNFEFDFAEVEAVDEEDGDPVDEFIDITQGYIEGNQLPPESDEDAEGGDD